LLEPLFIASQIASLKGEAHAWLRDPDYDALKHRLENAHAAVEAAAVEARRRVRLNEGRVGKGYGTGAERLRSDPSAAGPSMYQEAVAGHYLSGTR
jgi:hypothetical protein